MAVEFLDGSHGLGQAEFARQHGIHPTTFGRWCREEMLRRRPEAALRKAPAPTQLFPDRTERRPERTERKMPLEDVEQRIRDYLTSLNDPDALVDTAKVEALHQQAIKETDVIEKLVALSEMERLRHPDIPALEADFIEHAARFCERRGILPEMFRQVGVKPAVWRQAFKGDAAPSTPKTYTKTTAGRGSVLRGIQPDDTNPKWVRITLWASEREGTFSFKDVADALGWPVHEVRDYIEALLRAGLVQDRGLDKGWHKKGNRGRQPRLFARVTPSAPSTANGDEPSEPASQPIGSSY